MHLAHVLGDDTKLCLLHASWHPYVLCSVLISWSYTIPGLVNIPTCYYLVGYTIYIYIYICIYIYSMYIPLHTYIIWIYIYTYILVIEYIYTIYANIISPLIFHACNLRDSSWWLCVPTPSAGPPDRSACARNRRKSCVRESSSPCEGRAMPKSLGLERSLKPIKNP